MFNKLQTWCIFFFFFVEGNKRSLTYIIYTLATAMVDDRQSAVMIVNIIHCKGSIVNYSVFEQGEQDKYSINNVSYWNSSVKCLFTPTAKPLLVTDLCINNSSEYLSNETLAKSKRNINLYVARWYILPYHHNYLITGTNTYLYRWIFHIFRRVAHQRKILIMNHKYTIWLIYLSNFFFQFS